MTDLEISKALALAIGWREDSVVNGRRRQRVSRCGDVVIVDWRVFDYRDWNVIGPIMERYNASPIKSPKGTWSACVDEVWVDAIDTPQKAIALAVIQGAKK